MRRVNSENLQNRRRKIDISGWQIVHPTAAKIRPGRDQGIMHVESAESGVSPLPRLPLPIRVDHSWNTELIFGIIPAESHHNIRRVLIVDPGLLKTEGPLHRLFRENDSGKI